MASTTEYTPPEPRITQDMRDMSTEDVKTLIREVWGVSAPYGIAIAICEGGLRQFEPSGKILRGRVNPNDIGIMQINSDHHENTYRKMNIDIFTPYGNVLYAKYLYDRNGMSHWLASKSCWSGYLYGKT